MSNTTRVQTPGFLGRAVTGLLLFVLAVACDGATPTRPGPSLPEPTPYPNISGTYTLTLSASSGCRLELPEDLRTRTYTATIAQGGGSLTVMLLSIFPPWSNRTFGTDNRFTGLFGENNRVAFQLQFEEWLVGEQLGDFYAYGAMAATISPSGLSGSWDGFMMATVTNENNRRVTCTAPDHGVVFLRRSG